MGRASLPAIIRRKLGIAFRSFTCVGVIPLALICGTIRHIPFFWQLIDCSFGVLGAIPLLYCRKLEKQITAAGG